MTTAIDFFAGDFISTEPFPPNECTSAALCRTTRAANKQTKSMSEKLLVPAVEAAQMLSMGRSTFWSKVKQKQLPAPVKIAGLTRWRVSDLRTCIDIDIDIDIANANPRNLHDPK